MRWKKGGGSSDIFCYVSKVYIVKYVYEYRITINVNEEISTKTIGYDY